MSYSSYLAQAQVQDAVTQYMINNLYQQYNAANILGGGNYMGGSLTAGNVYGAGTGVGGYAYPQVTTANTVPIQSLTTIGQGLYSQQSAYTVPALPRPSGQIVPITFMDVNGLSYSLDIDAAYVQLLQAISYQHQWRAGAQQAKSYQQPKMLEGDFSEDEMSQAEQIIQEMNRGSQEPCECEA